jgi:hypothetical protein
VDFKFRGRNFRFALSQGLFSSADIDTGTRLFLKVLSKIWDEDRARGYPLPASVLDAGSGVGVVGICAAAALNEQEGPPGQGPPSPGAGSPVRVRSQDRDELARVFTEYNARQNGVPPGQLSAHTEPLLAGPPGARWDLILSNIPAKAGEPVLADFVSRSAGLLNAGGRVLVVAVNPLADFFRARIRNASLPLYREETGRGHTVLLYGPGESGPAAYPLPEGGEDLFQRVPAYLRNRGAYEIEGVSYVLDTCYGAASFDHPGGAVLAAAKLLTRLGLDKFVPPPEEPPHPLPVLIHGEDQGHFPAWLIRWAAGENPGRALPFRPLVLSGRNILALEACRHNTLAALGSIPGEKSPGTALVRPAVDLSPPDPGTPPLEEPAGRGYPFIAVFPEPVPQTGRYGSYWEGLARLLAPQGIVLAALSASEAERFDRKKPPSFTRLGDIKRKGFRALAYQNRGTPP